MSPAKGSMRPAVGLSVCLTVSYHRGCLAMVSALPISLRAQGHCRVCVCLALSRPDDMASVVIQVTTTSQEERKQACICVEAITVRRDACTSLYDLSTRTSTRTRISTVSHSSFP